MAASQDVTFYFLMEREEQPTINQQLHVWKLEEEKESRGNVFLSD